MWLPAFGIFNTHTYIDVCRLHLGENESNAAIFFDIKSDNQCQAWHVSSSYRALLVDTSLINLDIISKAEMLSS